MDDSQDRLGALHDVEPHEKPDEPKGFVDWLMILLFAFIVTVMLLSIFFRYVLNNSLSWTDEVIRFAFVWFVLLGAAIVFRDHAAIRVDVVTELLPSKWRGLLGTVSRCPIVAFYFFLLVAGMLWTLETRGTRMSSLDLPLNWCFYFSLPVTSAAALYFALRPLGKRKDDAVEAEETEGETLR